MTLLPAVPRQSLFVAGTDTGVGKTWVATRLLRTWVREGRRAAGMKPVAAGAEPTAQGLRNDDALALQAAANVALPYEVLNPVCLPRASSPHLAAADVGIMIKTETIRRSFEQIVSKSDLVLVEGAGGWWAPTGEPGAPGARGPTMEDVAVALGLPVLLVVGLRLGCLNHALLTAAAIRSSGLVLAGWVANPVDPEFGDATDYVASLRRRMPAPQLGLPDISL